MATPITDHAFVGKREWGIHPHPDKPCQYLIHGGPVCGRRNDEHFRSPATGDVIRDWTIPLAGAGDKYCGIHTERHGDEYVMTYTGTRAGLVRLARNILTTADEEENNGN